MISVLVPSIDSYSDLNTLASVPVSKSFVITNHSSHLVYVLVSPTQPLDTDKGIPLYSTHTFYVEESDTTVWIKGGPGSVLIQDTAESISPFNTVDLPNDVYTNDLEGQRRYKVSSEPSIGAAVFNGFGYTISGTFSVAAGAQLAMNISPASDIIIHKIVTNTNFPIEVYDEQSTGVADGIFIAANMNLLSVDSSPTQAQLYSDAVPQGNAIAAGIAILEPFIVAGFNQKPSVVVKNTGSLTAITRITVTFEEIGPRMSSFGLTASTSLMASTEMSTFG